MHPKSDLKSGVLSLYKNVSLGDRIHMSLRYLRCPFETLEGQVPETGRILDFGCGHGLLANVMAVRSKDRMVVGLDPSPSKIDAASRSIHGRDNIVFLQGGLEDIGTEDLAAVTVIDVLYLLPENQQIDLLKKIFTRLDDQGVLVIKEVPASRELRFRINYLQELIMVRVIKKTLGGRFCYRTEDQWINVLTGIGYQVRVTKLNTPAPSVLFVCRRG